LRCRAVSIDIAARSACRWSAATVARLSCCKRPSCLSKRSGSPPLFPSIRDPAACRRLADGRDSGRLQAGQAKRQLPPRAQERPGAHAEVSSEVAGKMTLIAEPAVERDATEGMIGLHQKLLRPRQPTLHQIGVRRGPDRLFERADEVTSRQTGGL